MPIRMPFEKTIANYILSQMVVWEVDFPGGISLENVKFRALTWAVSEASLFVCIALNYLPRKSLTVCPASL